MPYNDGLRIMSESPASEVDQIIKIAADWWADQLRTPPVHDVGDANLNDKFNTYHVKPELLPEEAIEAFSHNIRTLLKFYFENPEHEVSKMAFGFDDYVCLEVDYHPKLILRACMPDQLEGRLPLKTIMKVYKNRVEVKKGYGAPYEVLIHAAIQ